MNKRRTETPSDAEFGLLRAHLAQTLGGLTPSQLNQAIGQRPSGRTRAQVAADLAGWLRDRPRQ